MQRSRVDLPEPDRPMMTKISPSKTSKLASRTARDVATPAPAALFIDFAAVGGKQRFGIVAEHLPDMAATEFYRGVVGFSIGIYRRRTWFDLTWQGRNAKAMQKNEGPSVTRSVINPVTTT